jgi:glycosyltransferase involved in cell wall biosynthesis
MNERHQSDAMPQLAISGSASLGRIIMLNDFSVAHGGSTGIALLATRLLRSRGHKVVFITGDSGDNAELRDLGVKVVAFGGKSLLDTPRLTALRTGLWQREARKFLSHWIANNGRPNDVWHLHNWSQIWSPSVFSALEPVMDRLVVHAHEYFNACPNGAYYDYQAESACHRVPLSLSCLTTQCDKRNRIQKVWRSSRQAMLGRTFTGPAAPPLLLIHPGMVEPFRRAGLREDRMPVLRNPVTPFDDHRIPAEANDTFVFIGRLDEEKGALPLARAAARAKVPLKVIGSGPQAEAIAKAYPGALMTGWQDHAQIRDHVRTARALVMPSVYPEPFGLVAVEAMGSGIPVVASHTALLSSEILAADAGWSVDVRDTAVFSNLLRFICDATSEEIALKSRNAFVAASHLGLSPEIWCDRLEEAYQALVART